MRRKDPDQDSPKEMSLKERLRERGYPELADRIDQEQKTQGKEKRIRKAKRKAARAARKRNR